MVLVIIYQQAFFYKIPKFDLSTHHFFLILQKITRLKDIYCKSHFLKIYLVRFGKNLSISNLVKAADMKRIRNIINFHTNLNPKFYYF